MKLGRERERERVGTELPLVPATLMGTVIDGSACFGATAEAFVNCHKKFKLIGPAALVHTAELINVFVLK